MTTSQQAQDRRESSGEAFRAESRAEAMSTRLLINERPLTVLPSLVKLVGMERAVILQQIHWLLQGRHNGEMYDGYKWVWGTHDEWCEDYFSFWQPATLRKHMVWLENKGLLRSMQMGGWNRRKHYRIDYVALDQALQELEAIEHDDGASIEHDRTQCIEHDDTQSIEYDHDASMRDDHAGSMRDDHAACTIYTETSTETSTEKRSSSSSASSSEPEPEKSKDDDDDDLVFNSVVTAWNDGMPEKATKHIRQKLKELIAECGPDAVIGGILAAVEAGGRSFKYVATCVRNHAEPKSAYIIGGNNYADWSEDEIQAEIAKRDAEAAEMARAKLAKAQEKQP